MNAAANVRQMPLDEIVAEIHSWAQFAESTDLDEIQEAVDEVKSLCAGSREMEIVEAKMAVLSKLMLAYNAAALAKKAAI